MANKKIPARKIALVQKLVRCFQTYKQIILVKLDNVSTGQIQNARRILRNPETAGEMVIGKNSLIQKALEWCTVAPEENDPFYEQRSQITLRPELEALKEYIVLNVGLIFSDESYQSLRTLIESEVVEMPAKAGVLAPCNVDLPAGPTSLDAGKIDIFHKLNIPVKIARGTIEIQKDFPIIAKNEKVTEAAALMCRTLNMTPFRYTLEFKYVFLASGQIIDENIIAMEEETILDFFKNGVRVLTGLSLGANVPNTLSAPHMISGAFKIMLALGVASGYEFKQLKEAMTASANAVASGPADGDAGDAQADQEDEGEEEEDVSMGGLFSDSD